MIELPTGAVGGSAQHQKPDSGFLQRNTTGAITNRINRPSRGYILAMTYGPYPPELGSEFVASLLAAKTQGLRIAYPLQIDQSGSGSPVVDGAVQQGTTLAMRGLTPGYVCKKGFWFSISNEFGRHYLHNVEEGGIADASGLMSVKISPELRLFFADGATVHLSKPMVEGYPLGEAWEWETSVDRLVPIQFALEEVG